MAAPLILACDTTQGACSVALYGDGLIGEKLIPMSKGHAEALTPMMQDLLHETDTAMTDIARLAVTHGPGTFTGTRVGLAAMRGLALALKIPLKAYGTLHAMAQGAAGDAPLLVAVDARRAVFYAQGFDARRAPLGDAQALSGEAALALMGETAFSVLGSGAETLVQMAAQRGLKCHWADGDAYPHAGHVAALAAADPQWDAPAKAVPFYLRPPDATLPDRSKFPARLDASASASSDKADE